MQVTKQSNDSVRMIHGCENVFSGFTIIELLVTTVIAAILMLGVLTVVGQLGSDQRRLAGRAIAIDASTIVNLFRKDCVRANRITIDPKDGSLCFDGCGALDRASFAPIGRDALVFYRVAKSDAGNWLVREQRLSDETNRPSWVECVAPGVKHFSLVPDRPSAPARATEVPGQLKELSSRSPVLFSRLQLRIEWDDAKVLPIDQTIVLR